MVSYVEPTKVICIPWVKYKNMIWQWQNAIFIIKFSTLSVYDITVYNSSILCVSHNWSIFLTASSLVLNKQFYHPIHVTCFSNFPQADTSDNWYSNRVWAFIEKISKTVGVFRSMICRLWCIRQNKEDFATLCIFDITANMSIFYEVYQMGQTPPVRTKKIINNH